MSLVTFTIQPPGGAEVALDRDRILYRTARFASQVNGAPGDFYLQVRDLGHEDTFVAGARIRLYVDAVVKFTGFLMRPARTWPLPVVPVDNPQTAIRYWELSGVDLNILWLKRRIYDSADLTHVYKLYDPGTFDDTILDDILANYTDIITDLGLTTAIDRVGVAVLDIPSIMVGRGSPNGGAPWSAGDLLKSAFETVARATGGIFYITPGGVITYCDADTATSALELSDVPGAGQVGYRLLKLTDAGDQLANDVIVWGAALGAPQMVVSRVEDAPSIGLHGRWQKGLYSAGLYQQASADLIANTMVYGTPESLRGAKDPKIVFICTVNGAAFEAGQKVNCISNVFGFEQVLPVRKVTYTFPTPDFVVSELMLSYEIDAPWSIYESLWPPPFRGGPRPPPIPPLPEGCGITDTFNRSGQGDRLDTFEGRTVAAGAGWGTASDGHIWTGSSDPGAIGVADGRGFAVGGDGWQTVTDSAGPWVVADEEVFTMVVEFSCTDPAAGTSEILTFYDFNSVHVTQINWSDEVGVGRVELTGTPGADFEFTAGAHYYLKYEYNRTLASPGERLKIWLTTDSEPASWLLDSGSAVGAWGSELTFEFFVHAGRTFSVYDIAFEGYVASAGLGTADCGLVWDDFAEPGKLIVDSRFDMTGSTGAQLVFPSPLTTVQALWVWRNLTGSPGTIFNFGATSSGVEIVAALDAPAGDGEFSIRPPNTGLYTRVPFDFVSGTDYYIRVYADSASVKGKIWKTTEAEPGWMIDETFFGSTDYDSFFVFNDFNGHIQLENLDITGLNRCTIIDDEIIETFGSLPNTGEIIVTGSGSVGATQLSLPRPYLPGSTRVWLNGTQLYLGIDYTESDPAGGFLTLVTPVASLDDVYRTAFIANGPYPGEA